MGQGEKPQTLLDQLIDGARETVEKVPTSRQSEPTPEEVIEVSIDRLNDEWIEEKWYPDGRYERRTRSLRERKANVKVPLIWIGITVLLGLTVMFKPDLLQAVAQAIATIFTRAG